LTVLLDSCVWIEYFNGSAKAKKAVKYIESKETIIVSTINITEIYRHILTKKSIKEADAFTNRILQRAYIFPVSLETGVLSAQLKHEHKMTLGDALILATALLKKARLVTFDSDFKFFEHCEVL